MPNLALASQWSPWRQVATREAMVTMVSKWQLAVSYSNSVPHLLSSWNLWWEGFQVVGGQWDVKGGLVLINHCSPEVSEDTPMHCKDAWQNPTQDSSYSTFIKWAMYSIVNKLLVCQLLVHQQYLASFPGLPTVLFWSLAVCKNGGGGLVPFIMWVTSSRQGGGPWTKEHVWGLFLQHQSMCWSFKHLPGKKVAARCSLWRMMKRCYGNCPHMDKSYQAWTVGRPWNEARSQYNYA